MKKHTLGMKERAMRTKKRTRRMCHKSGATSLPASNMGSSPKVPRVTCGLGWHGKLRDVFSWAALEALCVIWGTTLLGAYTALVAQTLLATQRGTLSTETSTRALIGCTQVFIAHCFMLRGCNRVLQSFRHEVGIEQIMVEAPRNTPTMLNATKNTVTNVKSDNGKQDPPSSVASELVLGGGGKA
ncbi:hypothetical protein ANPL_00245 [Anaplasma platys]|uniref:Uncharacterized protein n=1 Tax=Anaplasma platys TaxID=949 RepID=A0A858PX67_9RICK|nr:hypothetical protein ANPL_00245 [Anaplasma platys]